MKPTPEEDVAWMVRWNLMGRPRKLPVDMLKTIPEAAFDAYRRTTLIFFKGVDGPDVVAEVRMQLYADEYLLSYYWRDHFLESRCCRDLNDVRKRLCRDLDPAKWTERVAEHRRRFGDFPAPTWTVRSSRPVRPPQEELPPRAKRAVQARSGFKPRFS